MAFNVNIIDNNKYIPLKDGTKLYDLPKNYKFFIGGRTILYGASNSGKSYILNEILYLSKDIVPIIFVVAPTNTSNGAFDGMIPSHFIKTQIDREWLINLWNRQKESAQAYKVANKLQNLRALFLKAIKNDRVQLIQEQFVITKVDNTIKKIDSVPTTKHNHAQKKSQKQKCIQVKEDILRELYKSQIRLNKVYLERLQLSDIEKHTLAFLDFNPNMVLVLDDCASQMKEWAKWIDGTENLIESIFYQGRHNYLTLIMTAQDDKSMKSEFRKNASLSIFTTPNIAAANFERSANNFDKKTKERALRCIEATFAQDPNSEYKHFRKLAYVNQATDPFRTIEAGTYDDFRMGGDPMWRLEERLKSESENLQSNSLFNKYSK